MCNLTLKQCIATHDHCLVKLIWYSTHSYTHGSSILLCALVMHHDGLY